MAGQILLAYRQQPLFPFAGSVLLAARYLGHRQTAIGFTSTNPEPRSRALADTAMKSAALNFWIQSWRWRYHIIAYRWSLYTRALCVYIMRLLQERHAKCEATCGGRAAKKSDIPRHKFELDDGGLTSLELRQLSEIELTLKDQDDYFDSRQ